MENTARRIPNQDKARHTLEEFLRLAAAEDLVGKYQMIMEVNKGGVRDSRVERVQVLTLEN